MPACTVCDGTGQKRHRAGVLCSFCDGTGRWPLPDDDAGSVVVTIDPQPGDDCDEPITIRIAEE